MADSTEPNNSASLKDRFITYSRTRKGRILLAETIISLVILICYSASIYSGYVTVAAIEMVFAGIFFFVFMMDWNKQMPFVSWIWSDFLRAVAGFVLYLITSLICVISGWKDVALLIGGVFGLLATVLFAYDTYLTFVVLKSSRQQYTATTVP
ncbi:proteolipid protein 2-like [Brienomyrus brachyistius]|uniref:proteolipid protein 2-like n=1 Tax=Brienomyrus brachyistius TaxID=42636 RepID=UPI0020B19C13|nr:proteolipid protein 2-like [Brienomyrus brachyistius]